MRVPNDQGRLPARQPNKQNAEKCADILNCRHQAHSGHPLRPSLDEVETAQRIVGTTALVEAHLFRPDAGMISAVIVYKRRIYQCEPFEETNHLCQSQNPMRIELHPGSANRHRNIDLAAGRQHPLQLRTSLLHPVGVDRVAIAAQPDVLEYMHGRQGMNAARLIGQAQQRACATLQVFQLCGQGTYIDELHLRHGTQHADELDIRSDVDMDGGRCLMDFRKGPHSLIEVLRVERRFPGAILQAKVEVSQTRLSAGRPVFPPVGKQPHVAGPARDGLSTEGLQPAIGEARAA